MLHRRRHQQAGAHEGLGDDHHGLPGGAEDGDPVIEDGLEQEDVDREQPPAGESERGLKALEDGRVQEDRLIGQEVVPVTPQTTRLQPGVDFRTPREPLSQSTKAQGSAVMARAMIPIGSAASSTTSTTRRERPPSRQQQPVGDPKSFRPLFNSEQLSHLERIQASAPHLYQDVPTPDLQVLPRPSFLKAEELRRQRMEEEEQRMWEVARQAAVIQNEQVMNALHAVREENELLREQNRQLTEALRHSERAAGALKFGTPEDPEDKPEVKSKGPEVFSMETPKHSPRSPEGAAKAQPDGAATEANGQEATLKIMLGLMQGMQEIQKKMLEQTASQDKDEDKGESETVRGGVQPLPLLQDWSATTGPIDLNDWLSLIEPQMSDLSGTSGDWWSKLLSEARSWYEDHMKLPPLQRLHHSPTASQELAAKKWQRLERRASTMLLNALPSAQREDLVSSKKLKALDILCSLLVTYQPGGLAEKELILRSLEAPLEANTIPEAVTGLRRWARWRRRASDLGVTEPDPFLLLKGLNRIVRKPLEAHRDLMFRISLARSTLQVDATPTSSTITSFALHLQAELEQMAHVDSGKKKEPEKEKEKIKTVKSEKVEEPHKEDGGDKIEVPKCNFYLTDRGCRKGRSCSFSHDQQDGKRRCYTCGATEHMAPACPRKSPSKDFNNGQRYGTKVKQVKEEEAGSSSKPCAEKEAARGDEKESTMTRLLEEANKMLKSLTKEDSNEKGGGDKRDKTLEALQQQINELKMKVLKISKMTKGAEQGLIDSGATHPLRPLKDGEILSELRDVAVVLASGEKKMLKMSKGGSMVTSELDIEPIIPMGILVQMGCEIRWDSGEFEIHHPVRGRLEVDAKSTGCPQLARETTLELIQEWEMRPTNQKKHMLSRLTKVDDGLVGWMRELVQVHPVLRQLPEEVRCKLAVQPGGWDLLPSNGRMRKRWERDGLMVHLFAGPDQGFTLSRALKQLGGQEAVDHLLEIDLERGSKHDMLADDGVYAGLLSVALQGKLEAIVGGPNCRTRSVLRHYPLPAGRPRPIRGWNGFENGYDDLDEEERAMIKDDDTMLWRMLFLYMISNYLKKARGQRPDTKILLEQPASPKSYMPEVVSFWDTWEWVEIKKEFSLTETTVNQGDHGGRAAKPTTFGGDLLIKPPPVRPRGQLQREHCGSSKELSRWAPGVMNMVATALKIDILKTPIKAFKLSWNEHILNNHTPYRRDCRICQETLQKQKPHRKIPHPWAGVLSLDTAGPFTMGRDCHAKGKYILVGAYTWVAPKSLKSIDEKDVEVPEGAAPLPMGRGGEDGDLEDLDADGQDEEQEIYEEVPAEDAEEIQADEEGEDHDPELQPSDDMEIKVYRLAVPMPSKGSPHIIKAAMEMTLRLRIDGYHITRVHSDQGKEFSGAFAAWARSRGYVVTRNSGDDPQANGRAEVAVQAVKNTLRRTLHESGIDHADWPLAVRHINEVFAKQRKGESIDFPPLNTTVLVRKRGWAVKSLEPISEEVKYIAPAWADHGHWVRKDGSNRVQLTRYVLMPAPRHELDHAWIALEKEAADDPATVRRRLRGKVAVKELMSSDADVEIHMRKLKAFQVIEEEMRCVCEDPIEVSLAAMEKILEVKKAVQNEPSAEEEVLQTRIVSGREVSQNWEEWLQALDSEVNSLLHEKEAFLKLDEDGLKEVRLKAQREGRQIEELPSKMVWTLKPDHERPGKGKRKARWVICGNYEEEKGHDTYSGGADATAFRLLVAKGAQSQWTAATLDIKTAFLNARMELQEGENMIVIRPPHVLTVKGYFKSTDAFIPLRAVYGLKRSPRLWGKHRDQVLRELEIHTDEGVLRLEPMGAEPNLWKVVPMSEFLAAVSWTILGLLMTYVDDIFITGEKKTVVAIIQKLRAVWTTTEPEFLGAEPVRFLGMEVSVHGEQGKQVWEVTQENYVKELLKGDVGLRVRKVPITKDQSLEGSGEKVAATAESVRQGQKQVGELLWLVTRTRPDLMFSVSRMSALITRDPQKVTEIGQQTRGFLLGTMKEGLKFTKNANEVLEVFTDASFAPGGEESHGCSVVCLFGAPLMWRCGRQTATVLSTAEAELLEMLEGMTAGESCWALVDELFHSIPKVLWSDSQSAISILSSEGGSWRTRHLRLRSLHARRLVLQGDWVLKHVAGAEMVADLGTKSLQGPRLEYLKVLMGMAVKECAKPLEAIAERDLRPEKANVKSVKEAQKIMQLLTMAVVLQTGYGSELELDEDEDGLAWPMMVYTTLVIFLTLALSGLWRRWFQRDQARLTEVTEPNAREVAERVLDPSVKFKPEVRDQATEAECDERWNDLFLPVFTSKGGIRYHTDVACRGLQHARGVKFSPLCVRCPRHLWKEVEDPVLFVGSPAEPAHVNALCPFGFGAKKKEMCRLCQHRDALERDESKRGQAERPRKSGRQSEDCTASASST